MINGSDNTIYTADKVILSNGAEYNNKEFYFINGFIAIDNTWINTAYITRIINISEK